MREEEIVHRLTATRLSAVNTFLFIALAFFGNTIINHIKIFSSINNINIWYWGIILIIAFIVTIYYEMAYREELRN